MCPHVKSPIFLSNFNKIWGFFERFSWQSPIPHFAEIRPLSTGRFANICGNTEMDGQKGGSDGQKGGRTDRKGGRMDGKGCRTDRNGGRMDRNGGRTDEQI